MSSTTKVVDPTLKPTLYEYLVKEKGNAGANFKTFMTKDRDFLAPSAFIYKSPKLIAFIELSQYILFIFLLYYYSPFEIGDKHPKFSSILSLLVATVYVVLFFFLKENIDMGNTNSPTSPITEMQFVKQILMTLFFFITSVFAVKFIVWYCNNSKMANIIRAAISLLFLISFLAIIYVIVAPVIEKAKANKAKGITSILGFLWDLVMYLPCLLLMFLEYMRRQFSITTQSVWLLLVLEVILVALFIVVPKILQKIATRNGVQLLQGPIYLNHEEGLGSFDEIYKTAVLADPDKQAVKFYDKLGNDVTTNLEKKFRYHYALSAWFYINPQPPNTSSAYMQYTPILSYANKPVLEYHGQLNSLRVRTETGLQEKRDSPQQKKKGKAFDPALDVPVMVELFETKDVLYQKWNHVVINYDGGTMDVFLNSRLVGSSPGISPYLKYENVTGGATNGIHGGLCNIMFYNNPLSESTIKMMYQLLRDKKNPLI